MKKISGRNIKQIRIFRIFMKRCSRGRLKYWWNTFGIGFVLCSFRRRRKWNSILKVFQQYLRRPGEHFFQNFLENVFPGTPQVLLKHLPNWIRVILFSKKAQVEFNSEGVSIVLATSPWTLLSDFLWNSVPEDAPSTIETPSELNSDFVESWQCFKRVQM